MIETVRSRFFHRSAVILLAGVLLLPLCAVAADRSLVSGPFSLTIRGGAQDQSITGGVDARIDYRDANHNNLHFFGTFEVMDAGQGLGEVDDLRFGAGMAISHTFPKVANLFVGTSFIQEMTEYFGHAYVGGKLQVTNYALLSASYGFGFGGIKEVQGYLAAESADWLKAGLVLVHPRGAKFNAYYTLTDPTDLKLSGVEGELSYPILDSLTLGVRGNVDLTDKTDVWRNWSSFAFLTYAVGGQKGSPIEVALDKNNPAEFPRIVKKNVQKAVAGSTFAFNIQMFGEGPPVQNTNQIVRIMANFRATSVTGGSGSYTYLWTLSSGDAYRFETGTNINSDRVDVMATGGSGQQTLTCMVRDKMNPSNAATLSVTLIQDSPF